MANRIAELRKENGWTLKELGNKINIRDNTLSQYETGKRQPSIDTLTELANTFNVSLDYLTAHSDVRSYSLTNNDNDILSILDKMDSGDISPDGISLQDSNLLAAWISNHESEINAGQYDKHISGIKKFSEYHAIVQSATSVNSLLRVMDEQAIHTVQQRLITISEDGNLALSAFDVLTFIEKTKNLTSEQISDILHSIPEK